MKTQRSFLLVASALMVLEVSSVKAADWFRDAQYGLFVHWGCYSVPAKGEWYLNSSQMDPAKYAEFADAFKAEKFDANDWIRKIKRWNMKYVVFTTRHHDGFAMWDSKVNPFNCMNRGPKRDILGELVPALRKAGIKVGYYYSPANWSREDYAGYRIRRWPSAANWKSEAARKSFVAYYKAELNELLAKYGAPDYLWWDGCLPRGLEGETLLKDLRKRYPQMICNDRMGRPFDVRTCEQEIRASSGEAWEACMTLNRSWGYSANDHKWKCRDEVLDMLVNCAGGRGNLLLNVGPKSDGTIPAESVAILDQVGAVLKRSGVEAAMQIYADSVLNLGDERGLRRVFDKIERGEEVRIAVMGGSITEGARAGGKENRWGEVFDRGWQELFPKGKFKFANFGIGATGSILAAFRYSRDVSPFKPDLIALEFSVNDGGQPIEGEAMRGLVRHAMREGASVMMLGMVNQRGTNAENVHLPVAKEHGVPYVSYRQGVWPKITSGAWKWESIAADGIHPNTFGHALAGELMNVFVRDSWRRYRLERSSKTPLPNPVVHYAFESGRLIPFSAIKTISCTGFKPAKESQWGEGLLATNAGARIEFECEGSMLGIVHRRGKEYSGRLKITVDGVESKEHPTAFQDIWWWFTPSTIILRDKPGKHRVTIEVGPEPSRPIAPIAFKLCALLSGS